MTPADYKTERKKRGTLKEVAALLEKHWTTIARRESGEIIPAAPCFTRASQTKHTHTS